MPTPGYLRMRILNTITVLLDLWWEVVWILRVTLIHMWEARDMHYEGLCTFFEVYEYTNSKNWLYF